MKENMKHVSKLALVLLVGLATAQSGIAQDAHKGHHGAAADTAAAAPLSAGEVKKIDKSAGKITIKHGPLVNLGMPAMTMVFRAKDPAMLTQVKTGDKVKFAADKVSGAYTVTKIDVIK